MFTVYVLIVKIPVGPGPYCSFESLLLCYNTHGCATQLWYFFYFYLVFDYIIPKNKLILGIFGLVDFFFFFFFFFFAFRSYSCD